MTIRRLYTLNDETIKHLEELKKLFNCNSVSEVIRKLVDDTYRREMKNGKLE